MTNIWNFLLLALFLPLGGSQPLTPLDEYVRRPDPTYKYELLSSRDMGDTTVYFLNLTSQTWKDASETTTPVWWHYLTIVVPTDLDTSLDTAFLVIGSGRNTDSGPPNPDSDSRLLKLREFSTRTRTVTSYLRQIPNQPIHFVKIDESRSEDSAIAYTWRRFIEDSSDPEILYRMPMTKATVRAMDATTSFVAEMGITVNRFMLSGASKRGWTTWTTAAVDPVPGRVFAIAPQVLSCLNFVENLHHHYRSLGGWTFAFGSYYQDNITQFIDHPNTQAMADIVDPYTYRSRLTMPKLLVSGASDEFFLADDSHYFFDDMLSPMYIWIVESTGHSITDSPRVDDVWHSMRNFYLHAATGTPMPTMTWVRNETDFTGSIRLQTNVSPISVIGYAADCVWDLEGVPWRDFRLRSTAAAIPTLIEWEEEVVEDMGDNTFFLELWKPLIGWRAFYIEVQFSSLSGSAVEDRLTFSSEVNIIPDTMPVSRCSSPEECWGTIV